MALQGGWCVKNTVGADWGVANKTACVFETEKRGRRAGVATAKQVSTVGSDYKG